MGVIRAFVGDELQDVVGERTESITESLSKAVKDDLHKQFSFLKQLLLIQKRDPEKGRGFAKDTLVQENQNLAPADTAWMQAFTEGPDGVELLQSISEVVTWTFAKEAHIMVICTGAKDTPYTSEKLELSLQVPRYYSL